MPDLGIHDTGYGCACASRDAHECISRRYGLYCHEQDHDALTDRGEGCECQCHYGWDDDEDATC